MSGNVVESEARVKADAKSRAIRTLVQGLVWDVLYAVGGALVVALGDSPQWSRAYFEGLGMLLVKTAATTALSWVMRHWHTPKVEIPDA